MLPVEKLARSAKPGADPASMTYAVTADRNGAFHVKVTVLPLALPLRLNGVPTASPCLISCARIREAEKHTPSFAPLKQWARVEEPAPLGVTATIAIPNDDVSVV